MSCQQFGDVTASNPQVDKDEKTSNKLIKQTVNVHEEQYAPIDHINNWKENQKSPYFSKSGKHVINHPGEVRADWPADWPACSINCAGWCSV